MIKTPTPFGFTALELLVVMVIIGVLGAIAAPIFVSVQVDARAETIRGINANMQTAVNSVYAKARIANKTSLRNSTLSINGKTVRIRYGYPDGRDLRNVLLSVSPASNFTIASNARILRFRHVGAARANRCQVQYTRSNNPNTAPTYALDVRQC